MAGAYKQYLPDINVDDGAARVMNNAKLYIKLLGKFDVRTMTDELIDAIVGGDFDAVTKKAHALKGAAANLSCEVIRSVALQIEISGKECISAAIFIPELEKAATALIDAIAQLTAAETA